MPANTSGMLPSATNSAFPTEETFQKKQELTKIHIDSFNFALQEGLNLAKKNILPVDFQNDKKKEYIKLSLEDVGVATPSDGQPIYPAQCREGRTTYEGDLVVTIKVQVGDDAHSHNIVKSLGRIPLMVKSSLCHLAGKGPRELALKHEEGSEMGGYFIINGSEKVMRSLQMPKRNHVLALDRPSFQKRGPQFTSYGCSIRCVRKDESACTVIMHYLSNGSATVRFVIKKQEFFIPVVLLLKAFANTTDKEIYERTLCGNTDNTFLSERLEMMINDTKGKFPALHSQQQVLAHLGAGFRHVLDCLPIRATDVEAGKFLLQNFIFIHLEDSSDKYELALLMLRKLYAFVNHEYSADSSDSLMNQELLVSGHLYLMILKEKLQEHLLEIKRNAERDIKKDKTSAITLADMNYLRKLSDRVKDVGVSMKSFMSTGNLVSSTGLDLLQISGYTIVADKLNVLRYASHFRAVHRGQFFTEMKTTAVRKLLPEFWGFVCPVHTPDGSPCGLLNHIAANAHVVTEPIRKVTHIPARLVDLGMRGLSTSLVSHTYLPVLLDGMIIGHVHPDQANDFVNKVRACKVKGLKEIPSTIEVAYLPKLEVAGGPMPGVFLFTQSARMLRPVMNLKYGTKEFIGPMEQVFMEIACLDEDIHEDTTHREFSPTQMLSMVASLTPFSDLNQSPRNMYQCQMGKQTMGTPMHAYGHRTDNKIYRIQTPQCPLVQNENQSLYGIDEYPQGTNAVVAVISYTGYDMEDAMILNKGAMERGFGHASVYKNIKVDLEEERLPTGAFTNIKQEFVKEYPEGHSNKNIADEHKYEPRLGGDGFAPLGTYLKKGDPVYGILDQTTGNYRVVKHKDAEPAYLEEVRLVAGEKRAVVKLRYNRNPIVGDKFSSRHGQKGVLSVLWPQEDMPFSESGMTPDVIINPHAFPSRMTIGMLVESMAGKSGALNGKFLDSTPFRFNENQMAVDYFGEQLKNAGYNYYGNEPLYSGTLGVELRADIFIGCVYYQRLRHMVSDKHQVRATGPIQSVTRQPIKGRKRGGGIRFGEMERDSMLGHGSSFILHDRLSNCSDEHHAMVCKRCGSLLSSLVSHNTQSVKGRPACVSCKEKGYMVPVSLPYVYRYLSNELAGMNIKMTMDIKENA
eukprot:TRINITY_DN284_c0_g1_i1.p1 TRINITY_DN284_c0_g1~~TRINITY_DN284_c0_g1_i1.p1  ORF type:complete len:1136 (-),score=361.07 TRINITY_DN284_c0_g1_i1:415-3822(-)